MYNCTSVLSSDIREDTDGRRRVRLIANPDGNEQRPFQKEDREIKVTAYTGELSVKTRAGGLPLILILA